MPAGGIYESGESKEQHAKREKVRRNAGKSGIQL